LIKCAAK